METGLGSARSLSIASSPCKGGFYSGGVTFLEWCLGMRNTSRRVAWQLPVLVGGKCCGLEKEEV